MRTRRTPWPFWPPFFRPPSRSGRRSRRRHSLPRFAAHPTPRDFSSLSRPYRAVSFAAPPAPSLPRGPLRCPPPPPSLPGCCLAAPLPRSLSLPRLSRLRAFASLPLPQCIVVSRLACETQLWSRGTPSRSPALPLPQAIPSSRPACSSAPAAFPLPRFAPSSAPTVFPPPRPALSLPLTIFPLFRPLPSSSTSPPARISRPSCRASRALSFGGLSAQTPFPPFLLLSTARAPSTCVSPFPRLFRPRETRLAWPSPRTLFSAFSRRLSLSQAVVASCRLDPSNPFLEPSALLSPFGHTSISPLLDRGTLPFPRSLGPRVDSPAPTVSRRASPFRRSPLHPAVFFSPRPPAALFCSSASLGKHSRYGHVGRPPSAVPLPDSLTSPPPSLLSVAHLLFLSCMAASRVRLSRTAAAPRPPRARCSQRGLRERVSARDRLCICRAAASIRDLHPSAPSSKPTSSPFLRLRPAPQLLASSTPTPPGDPHPFSPPSGDLPLFASKLHLATCPLPRARLCMHPHLRLPLPPSSLLSVLSLSLFRAPPRPPALPAPSLLPRRPVARVPPSPPEVLCTLSPSATLLGLSPRPLHALSSTSPTFSRDFALPHPSSLLGVFDSHPAQSAPPAPPPTSVRAPRRERSQTPAPPSGLLRSRRLASRRPLVLHLRTPSRPHVVQRPLSRRRASRHTAPSLPLRIASRSPPRALVLQSSLTTAPRLRLPTPSSPSRAVCASTYQLSSGTSFRATGIPRRRLFLPFLPPFRTSSLSRLFFTPNAPCIFFLFGIFHLQRAPRAACPPPIVRPHRFSLHLFSPPPHPSPTFFPPSRLAVSTSR